MTTSVHLGFPAVISDLPRFSDESRYVWSHCWVAAGVNEMIESVGDVLPATIGDHGVHILRGPEGDLSAGYNSRQQGSCWNIPVQCGNGSKVTCAYVSCGHSRDGGILRAGTDQDQLIRQVVGISPSRRRSVRMTELGPALFVGLPGHDPGEVGLQFPVCSPILQRLRTSHTYLCDFRIEHTSNWRSVSDHVFAALGLAGQTQADAVELPYSAVLPGIGLSHNELWSKQPSVGPAAPEIQLYRNAPNLIVVDLGGHAAVLTVKPVNLGRSEISVALYGVLDPSAHIDYEALSALMEVWRQILSAVTQPPIDAVAFATWAERLYERSKAAEG